MASHSSSVELTTPKNPVKRVAIPRKIALKDQGLTTKISESDRFEISADQDISPIPSTSIVTDVTELGKKYKSSPVPRLQSKKTGNMPSHSSVVQNSTPKAAMKPLSIRRKKATANIVRKLPGLSRTEIPKDLFESSFDKDYSKTTFTGTAKDVSVETATPKVAVKPVAIRRGKAPPKNICKLRGKTPTKITKSDLFESSFNKVYSNSKGRKRTIAKKVCRIPRLKLPKEIPDIDPFESSSDEDISNIPATSSAKDLSTIDNSNGEGKDFTRRVKRYKSAADSNAFCKYRQKRNGTWVFNPGRIRYSMGTCKDSPDFKYLKSKRFNASFKRNTLRRREELIFAPKEIGITDAPLPEEDMDSDIAVPGGNYVLPARLNDKKTKPIKFKRRSINFSNVDKKTGKNIPIERLIPNYDGFTESDWEEVYAYQKRDNKCDAKDSAVECKSDVCASGNKVHKAEVKGKYSRSDNHKAIERQGRKYTRKHSSQDINLDQEAKVKRKYSRSDKAIKRQGRKYTRKPASQDINVDQEIEVKGFSRPDKAIKKQVRKCTRKPASQDINLDQGIKTSEMQPTVCSGQLSLDRPKLSQFAGKGNQSPTVVKDNKIKLLPDESPYNNHVLRVFLNKPKL